MIDYLMLYFVWFIYLGVVLFVVFMDLIAEKCTGKASVIRDKWQYGDMYKVFVNEKMGFEVWR